MSNTPRYDLQDEREFVEERSHRGSLTFILFGMAVLCAGVVLAVGIALVLMFGARAEAVKARRMEAEAAEAAAKVTAKEVPEMPAPPKMPDDKPE